MNPSDPTPIPDTAAATTESTVGPVASTEESPGASNPTPAHLDAELTPAPAANPAAGPGEPESAVGSAGAESAAAAPPPAPAGPSAPVVPAQPVPSVPPAPQPHDLSRIAQDLQVRKGQVEAVVQLLDEENTVPFITRYRKERTGGLNEEVIRRVQERIANLRALAERKRTILKSIAYQGKLTEALTQAVLAAEFPKRLEDLYLPYKPKKKSKATEAREKGLGPLAEAIWARDPAVAKLDEVLPGLVDPDKWVLNTDDVLAGVKDVLADLVADSADVRGPLRNFIWDVGLIAATRVENLPEGKGKEYEPYASFKEPVRDIPPHRVLAINRGEKANVLRVRVDVDREKANEIAAYHLNLADHPHRDLLLPVAADALDRLVLPSLEREVRRELTERAQDHAVLVFAKNLRSLLLQPPLRGKKVLAVDPGIRTGCKLAVLDETGKLLEDAVVYPHGQKKNAADSKRKLEQLVRKHQISVVAIGNGTGCRETEQLVADLIADLENRRLNPAPVVSPAESVSGGPAPAAAAPAGPSVTPPTHEPAAETHTTEAHPAPSGTIVSDPVFPAAGVTFTSDVHAPPPDTTAVETTGAPAPAGETVTTGAPGAAGLPAPRPPAPEISLDGLPDAPTDLAYVIVIEAGASDYSASPVAREEFPTLDATTRGTISIGRRLQDPLAELVKIDPQHIGVGLYQHDVKPKHLKDSLEAVIESCVNQVGVDLNTASVPLLRHVSGMNQLVARSVVEYRERNGAFASRDQLIQVAGLGDKRYTQAAGFLKIPDAGDPLDTTWIHPESYPAARQILADLGFTPADLRDKVKLDDLRGKLAALDVGEVAARLKAGEPTVRDILDALGKPGRDPREDVPPPIFKKGVLKLEDINPGMELKGTVLNVVPFGAFVDIGLKESGLVHISQMANRYIKSPYDVVAVGDVVSVWVIEVKPGEKKISLSMIPPGQERRPPERGRFA
ncbi:MAG: rps1, partial [Gemmataceae bacterium]|nr:rps1 [Gemmataceae bacterium]